MWRNLGGSPNTEKPAAPDITHSGPHSGLAAALIRDDRTTGAGGNLQCVLPSPRRAHALELEFYVKGVDTDVMTLYVEEYEDGKKIAVPVAEDIAIPRDQWRRLESNVPIELGGREVRISLYPTAKGEHGPSTGAILIDDVAARFITR